MQITPVQLTCTNPQTENQIEEGNNGKSHRLRQLTNACDETILRSKIEKPSD